MTGGLVKKKVLLEEIMKVDRVKECLLNISLAIGCEGSKRHG